MQENLDVVISFVIIIIALSVILQLVMDMIKNLLNLKWGVYEEFMKRIYAQNFQFEDVAKKDTEGKLTKIFRRRFRKIGALGPRLTSFYQQVNSFLSEIQPYRNKMFEVREAMEKAETVEEKWKAFTQGVKGLNLDVLRQTIRKLEKLFEIFFTISSAKENIVDKLMKDVDLLAENFKETATPGAQTETPYSTLMEKIDSLFGYMTEIEKMINQIRTRLSEKVEDWRRSLEHHYERSIAMWTFWVGLIVVFALNADAVVIYSTLRNESAVRASVISNSDMLSNTVTMPSRSERLNDLYAEAKTFKQRLEKEGTTTTAEFTKLVSGLESLGKAIVSDAEAYNQNHKAKGSDGFVVDLPFDVFRKDKGAIDALKSSESKIKDGEQLGLDDANELKDRIDSGLIQIGKNYLALQTGIINSQKNLIYSTNLPIGWDRHRLDTAIGDFWSFFKKILGCLGTAILISFGAPFWNNILKSLFGIRNFLRNSPKRDGQVVNT